MNTGTWMMSEYQWGDGFNFFAFSFFFCVCVSFNTPLSYSFCYQKLACLLPIFSATVSGFFMSLFSPVILLFFHPISLLSVHVPQIHEVPQTLSSTEVPLIITSFLIWFLRWNSVAGKTSCLILLLCQPPAISFLVLLFPY